MGPLTSLIEPALARNRGAAVTGAAGTAIAGRSLLASAKALSHALLARGSGRGEPVICRIGNRPGDLAALLAVWLAGGVAVPVAATAAGASLANIQGATGARLGLDGGTIETIALDPVPARTGLNDAALVVFTSGSTGRPKGVVLGAQQLAGKLEVLHRLIKLRPDEDRKSTRLNSSH